MPHATLIPDKHASQAGRHGVVPRAAATFWIALSVVLALLAAVVLLTRPAPPEAAGGTALAAPAPTPPTADRGTGVPDATSVFKDRQAPAEDPPPSI